MTVTSAEDVNINTVICMLNYFNVIQRHIGSNAVYNYHASRGPRNGRTGMIKNTKWLNKVTWGKTMIGVHGITPKNRTLR